jgi:hypothetical protein
MKINFPLQIHKMDRQLERRGQLRSLVEHFGPQVGILDVAAPKGGNTNSGSKDGNADIGNKGDSIDSGNVAGFLVGRHYPRALEELLSPLILEDVGHRLLIQAVYLEHRLVQRQLVPLWCSLRVPQEDRWTDLEKLLSLLSGLLHKAQSQLGGGVVVVAGGAEESNSSRTKKDPNKRSDLLASQVETLQRQCKQAFASPTAMKVILHTMLHCIWPDADDQRERADDVEVRLRCFTLTLVILWRLLSISDPVVPIAGEARNAQLWKTMKRARLLDLLLALLNDDTQNVMVQSRQRELLLIFSAAFAHLPIYPGGRSLLSGLHADICHPMKRPRHLASSGTMTVTLATGQEVIVRSVAQLMDPLGPLTDAGKRPVHVSPFWEFTPPNLRTTPPSRSDLAIEADYWHRQALHMANAGSLTLFVRAYLAVSDKPSSQDQLYHHHEDLLHYEVFLMFAHFLHSLQRLVLFIDDPPSFPHLVMYMSGYW